VIWLLAELLLCVVIIAAVVGLGLDASVEGALQAAASRSGALEREAGAVLTAARSAGWIWAAGIGAMMLGRLIGGFRSRGLGISAPLLLPCIAAMTGLGLMLQWGFSDPLHAASRFYYGPGFAPGVLYGGILAGLVMAIPWDPAHLAVRLRVLIGGGAALLMVALALIGDAPGSSSAKINLFGVQPIELVKLAFVAFLAASMGRQIAQLRYQRSRLGFLHWPRLSLLVPALALTAALFLLMFVVRDLGPTLILSAVLLAFYYAAVRSWIEVALIAGFVLVSGLVVVFLQPPFLPDNVLVRADMMRDPWLNGHSGGDQLAAGLWAMAAGGLTGQGPGQGAFGALPAGHTDLILAHLTEIGGLVGLAAYTLALLGLVLTGLRIAWSSRTPERALLALGISALLLAQWVVIFFGTVGWLPLTGVVVPYLSFGKTSMIVFLLAAGLLGRLAADGMRQVEMDELVQLRGGILVIGAAGVLLCGLGGLIAGVQVGLGGPKTTTSGVLTVGWDDTVFFRHDPRIRAIAAQIPRGEIRDRAGVVLAGPGEDGARTWPLGESLGTLLGPVGQGIEAPSWAIEGMFDARLRGIEEVAAPLSVFIEQRPDTTDPQTGEVTSRKRDRILFTVQTDELLPDDLARAQARIGPNSTVLFTRVKRLDYMPLVPLLHLTGDARAAAIAAVADDIDSRSVTLSLDASLQATAGALVRDVGPDYGRAAAVVVLDVDTGQVLARAQWPDYDPGDPDRWAAAVRRGDPQVMGSYGLWKDKTGVGGLYQAGSIFKVATALAAVRSGQSTSGRRCGSTGQTTYTCSKGPDCSGRPCVDRPGWSQPIHDGHSAPDGTVELSEALEVSCNVYFAQLGIDLGEAAFQSLVADGMEIDRFPAAGTFQPGADGSHMLASTAYGQGAARMHVMQAARMIATVGGGGIYRKCPPSMLLSDTCEEHRLADAGALDIILAGMRKVIDSGTARSFSDLDGVRVYGKTGTATDPGRSDEAAYGIRRNSTQNPHSWFIAIAESASVDACEPAASGRIAVAAVVPRGGGGSGAARLIAQGIIAEASRLGYFAR
jgi:cell division protein FtsW (lipid II flippase)